MLTETLNKSVQHNCNLADAKHAANYTLCTYLMKMREFCRWDLGYSLSDKLPKEAVGEWVSQREALWEDIEQQDYQALTIDGQRYDPFDTTQINAKLLPQGLVYSGGIGKHNVPHFFLAQLESQHNADDYQVIVTTEEYARDLSAPPAMTLGNTIFIRKQSVRRMLWEKVQEWRWHKIENAMSRALSYYPFADDPELALDQMTETELQSILLHEQGEIETTRLLGDEWKQFLGSIDNSRLELMLRSIKDLYADACVTLPQLIQSNNVASLYFFAGNMTALRKDLCPSFSQCYEAWRDSQDLSGFQEWVQLSQQHWKSLIERIMGMQNADVQELTTIIESQRF